MSSAQPKFLDERYQMSKKEIGDGSTSRVFEATEAETGKRVALKLLNHKSWNKPAKLFFDNETNALEKLCHENIIKLEYCGQAKSATTKKSEEEDDDR